MSPCIGKFITAALIGSILSVLFPVSGHARGSYRPHSGSRSYSPRSHSYAPSTVHVPRSAKGYTHNPPLYSPGGGVVHRAPNGKIARNMPARHDFLKQHGLSKVPKGYQVDHIKPLYAGGADTPSNMQLLTTAEHRAKTRADYGRYGR